MIEKIFVYELLAKMLSANQIAGFFRLEYLLNYMRYQLDFLQKYWYPTRLLNDQNILSGQNQVWAWV